MLGRLGPKTLGLFWSVFWLRGGTNQLLTRVSQNSWGPRKVRVRNPLNGRRRATVSDAIRSKIIRAEIVCAYSHCPRKAFLLHCTEERGTPHEYAGIVEERTKVKKTRYLAALQQTSTSVCSYSDGGISSGIDVLMEAHLTAAILRCIVMFSQGSVA